MALATAQWAAKARRTALVLAAGAGE